MTYWQTCGRPVLQLLTIVVVVVVVMVAVLLVLLLLLLLVMMLERLHLLVLLPLSQLVRARTTAGRSASAPTASQLSGLRTLQHVRCCLAGTLDFPRCVVEHISLCSFAWHRCCLPNLLLDIKSCRKALWGAWREVLWLCRNSLD